MNTENIKLHVSFPPHVFCQKTVSSINYNFLIALIPTIVAGIYYFGIGALQNMVVSLITALLCEAGIQKFLKRDIMISDGHALLIGLLVSFLCPPNLPWWMMMIGSACAVVAGKMVFGELGNNPFCPPLIGWVMLRLSWPDSITYWIEPRGGMIPDHPLWVFKFDGIEAFLDYNYHIMDLLVGRQAGGIGTTCAIALIAGGIYLLIRRIIPWQIPTGYFGSMFLFSLLLWFINRDQNLNPIFHLITGSTILVGFFIATDPVTSPVTRWGKLIFGIICGSLIILIRKWGMYPDGAVFAVLLGNSISPLLSKIRPRAYGKEKQFA